MHVTDTQAANALQAIDENVQLLESYIERFAKCHVEELIGAERRSLTLEQMIRACEVLTSVRAVGTMSEQEISA